MDKSEIGDDALDPVTVWESARDAWLEARIEDYFPDVDLTGQERLRPQYLPDWVDFPAEGRVLEQASIRLAERAARIDLDPTPALKLARELRDRGYREVDGIPDVEILVEAVRLKVGQAGESFHMPEPERQLDEVQVRALQVLKAQGGSVKFDLLTRLVQPSMTDRNFRRVLEELRERALIGRNGRGLYWHIDFDRPVKESGQ